VLLCTALEGVAIPIAIPTCVAIAVSWAVKLVSADIWANIEVLMVEVETTTAEVKAVSTEVMAASAIRESHKEAI